MVRLMRGHLIHLICGSTGAGKTTYARALSQRLGGVRFSIDEWMTALFWMDSPQPLDPAWSLERVERCSSQIWRVALDVAARGVPCILDVGLTTAAQRGRYLEWAAAAGLSAQLHYLDVPAEERWRRVQARNRDTLAHGQLTFEVTREMFDFVEGLWEPPTEAEMAAADGARVQA
jgi:predicted kinase